MEPDDSRMFDIQEHHGIVSGFDGSEQISLRKGKYAVRTGSKERILKDVWIVPNMTEPLVSLPAFVSQLGMHLLLDGTGMYELIRKNDGTYTKGSLMSTFHDNTWTMVPGIIGRKGKLTNKESNLVLHDPCGYKPEQARLGTFTLPKIRTNKTDRCDSFRPQNREILMHHRSGCLSASGMLEVIKHDAIRNYFCTKEGVHDCIGKTTGKPCYGCFFTANKFGVDRRRGLANSSDYRKASKNPQESSQGLENGHDIATDTFGPLPEDHKGHRWGQVFVDIQTRVGWVYLMKTKGTYFQVLQQFLEDFRTKYPKRGRPAVHQSDTILTFEGRLQGTIQTIRSDNAPELTSKQVDKLLRSQQVRQLAKEKV